MVQIQLGLRTLKKKQEATFKSHMVQIQPRNKTLDIILKERLNPTWFRYNSSEDYRYSFVLLFKSHMVQIQLVNGVMYNFGVYGLNPTWFRYNSAQEQQQSSQKTV